MHASRNNVALCIIVVYVCVYSCVQAERDRLEREKRARKEAERKQQLLEKRLQDMQEEARQAKEAKARFEQMMALLNEKVKVAEEEAQTHARKNFEAEEEIRRVRATAVKVGDLPDL